MPEDRTLRKPKNLAASKLMYCPKIQERVQLIYLIIFAAISFSLRCYIYQRAVEGDWSRIVYPDERNYYLEGAKLFLNQGWSYFLTPRSLWNAPLTILTLALFQLKIGWLKLFHLLLITLSSVMVWDIARRRFGYAWAWLAFACVTLHQPFWVFGPTILSEPIFTFLLTLFGWILLVLPNTFWATFAAGFTIGLACYARPTPQYYLLVLFALGSLQFLRSGFSRSSQFRRKIFGLALGMLLCISPWLTKNYLLFGKLGIATGSGAVLYLGNDLRKNGDEPVYSQMDFDTFEITNPHSHLDLAGDRALANKAKEWIFQFPAEIALLSIKKFLRLLFGNPAAFFYPSSSWSEIYEFGGSLAALKKASDIFLTLSVTLLGFLYWNLHITRTFATLCLGALIWYFFLLHSVAFAIPRMLLPTFPLLTIGAIGAAQLVYQKEKGFRIFLSASLLILFSFLYFVSTNWRDGFEKISENHLNYYNCTLKLDPAQAKLHQLEKSRDVYVSSGLDPFIEFEVSPTPLQKNQVFLFHLSALIRDSEKSSGSVQIFWRTAGQEFSEKQSIAMQIELNGKDQLYRLSPSLNTSWRGDLVGLRFDFPNNLLKAKYTLRDLSLCK